jgi:hypothetical protein
VIKAATEGCGMTRAVPGGMLTGSHIARSLDDTQSLCVTVAGWDRAVKARCGGTVRARLVP